MATSAFTCGYLRSISTKIATINATLENQSATIVCGINAFCARGALDAFSRNAILTWPFAVSHACIILQFALTRHLKCRKCLFASPFPYSTTLWSRFENRIFRFNKMFMILSPSYLLRNMQILRFERKGDNQRVFSQPLFPAIRTKMQKKVMFLCYFCIVEWNHASGV